MSFGFSVGDFLEAGKLVKKTLENIKSAPQDFKEAAKTLQSLDVLLTSLKLEVESTTSVFRRDPTQAEQFSLLVRLFHGPLTRLNATLAKHPSLGADNSKLLDRIKFSKKAVLEIRGEIALRYANLSAYLDTVGLGSIGRLEKKVDGIRDAQDSILEAIDRVVADARSKRNTASYLSNHSNDDKAVWKQLRRDLNNAGFHSADIERHKMVICDKLKELQDYGLLDWDSASAAEHDGDSVASSGAASVIFVGHEKRRYKPPTVETIYEGSELCVSDCETVVAPPVRQNPKQDFRFWKGRRGNINIRARLVRANVEHVYVETKDKEEILLPISNLDSEEAHYVNQWKRLESLTRQTGSGTSVRSGETIAALPLLLTAALGRRRR